MRSLTSKVVLAFAAVCLIEALLVAFLVRNSIRQSFDRFVEEEAVRIFTEDISSYFEEYGTLDGLSASLAPSGPQRPPGGPPGERAPGRGTGRGRGPGERGPMYGFADPTGLVIVSNGYFQPGDLLTKEQIDEGKYVSINASIEGIILSPHEEPLINPQARQYLVSTDRALLFALSGSFTMALVLGALFARSYMKPLRELTAATREISQGTTHEPIQVRTNDEIGVLTSSFNQMAAELERARQTRRQMTADIAHELRSPLGILTGYLEAFQSGDLKPNPERVNTMFTEAKHLQRLIEDLRILALADANELPLSREEVHLEELLTHSKDAFSQAVLDAQLSMHVGCQEGLPLVLLDPVRITQVLNNLIGNALRYTSPGGSITLSAHAASDLLEIGVADTGIGIPEASLPHIFDRFYKADASRTGHLETSGLGLAIARSFVEAHGGTITVRSEEGVGTTFMIHLPLNE